MVTPLTTKLAVTVGGLALFFTAFAGVASANPAVNTTCSYSQLVAALNAHSPATAAQFNESRAAQAWLRSFLAAPLDKRERMARDAQSVPGAGQYVGLIGQIANTCHSY